ncbi:PPPDE peptidase domain-containing protein [Dioscorea alata]|uniref:PPPDE peptidase domain-containing protein n=1 Tax=Dioscorea alata TaxID=55571 RepID=A0ACB7UBG2_DIOAL|nr:PPPDE peptidase domain-containing protein [Dioscorea alata]
MGSFFSSSSRSSYEALGGTQVVLNVYDLTPLNNYMYWFGLGIYHSGIEIHGLEYGFGAHDFPATGVFEVEPKNCPGFVYRRSITLGSISLSPSETHTFMEQLASDYHGDTYHLISKNCNHFTNDVSSKLIGKPIPGWVNRLARLGCSYTATSLKVDTTNFFQVQCATVFYLKAFRYQQLNRYMTTMHSQKMDLNHSQSSLLMKRIRIDVFSHHLQVLRLPL